MQWFVFFLVSVHVVKDDAIGDDSDGVLGCNLDYGLGWARFVLPRCHVVILVYCIRGFFGVGCHRLGSLDFGYHRLGSLNFGIFEIVVELTAGRFI